MAGQRPYEPNDPPRQPAFKLPKETDVMPEQPKQPTHEQLRQQAPQPNPQAGNLQNILAYFASQGVTDDHVVATIGGFPLKLSELKQAGPSQQHQPAPPKQEHKQNEEHRKRPSKGEENDGS